MYIFLYGGWCGDGVAKEYKTKHHFIKNLGLFSHHSMPIPKKFIKICPIWGGVSWSPKYIKNFAMSN